MKKTMLTEEKGNNRIAVINRLLQLCAYNDYNQISYTKNRQNKFTAIIEINGKRVAISTEDIGAKTSYFFEFEKCDIVVYTDTNGIAILFNQRLRKDNHYIRIESDNDGQVGKYASRIFEIINDIDSTQVKTCMAMMKDLDKNQSPKFNAILRRKIRKKNAEIMSDEKKAFQFITNKDKNVDCALIDLFYGTNRNIEESGNINKVFGAELSELTLGVCKVLIPKKENHREGEIERPYKFLNIEFPEVDGKHFILKELNIFEEKEFTQMLSENLKNSENTALIFIHGYNTSFAEAAYRTAQIVYDLPFSGVGSFFSWPSTGNFKDYLLDDVNASSSVTKLENFIKIFLSEAKIKKLYLIAHSMGNKVLSFTLKNLSQDGSIREQLEIIHQIILAAPDISQDEFKNELLPKINQINARKTLYASDKDKALELSQFIRSDNPRLGQAGENLFISDGIDTVDATNVPSNTNGHSYIFDTKELLTDLFLLLKHNSDPIDRRLREEKKNELKYWLFPLQK